MVGRIKKQWRKYLAGFFASIMLFQATSGVMSVAAYELGKVNLADSYGSYYQQNLINHQTLNEDTPILDGETVAKEPRMDVVNEEYDESLEIVEKRTENSKTYQLSDGSYVTDTYFEPIHKKEGDNFVEIDNTLENISKNRSTPIYENKDGLYTFKVQDNSASMSNEEGHSFTLTNEEANVSTYNVKENVILYSEAYPNIDMEYRLGGSAVTTHFYINGVSDTNSIHFTIQKGNLKIKEESDALVFIDENEKEVFSYTKPVIYDGKDATTAVDFEYQEDGENVLITLGFNSDWTNSSDRIYPLSISSRVADENVEINVDTAYNRSASPTITSNYYDLYVGYEDGSTSGGTFLGVTRTYVHISNLNLGSDKIIVDAKLKLWKRIQVTQQWNEIQIGKTAGYVKPSDATWNNKPSVTPISTTNVRSDPGWQEFDIKSYVEDIYNGKNNTIELKATNESSAYTPNVFSSESGTGLPKVSVTYRDAFDVNPSLPVDTFDSEMRIFSILNKGFEALSFDGIAKPDSQVVYELVERGKDDVIATETSKGNANRYFIDPIYITNQIANTQTYAKDDVNYTTDYIYKDAIPEFDTPYEYKVKVKNSSLTSTKEFRTDSFIKYKVKAGDNLKNIASYYGVSIDELKSDNNLTTNIIKEDDVLFVRFKKNNDKVSKDVYTPPLRTVDYKAKYVNRGPRCSSGVCEIIDPVNSTTGNYYYEGIDFSIRDADDFDFTRYYNSTGPQFSNMFGNGFTTPIESYISYDKEGNILYFAGDGKIFEFEKNGSSFEAKAQDRMEITYENEKATIKDLDTEITYYFDDYGYLDKMVSKEGTTTQIHYDEYGLITSLHVGEKEITITYNDEKLVKDMTLPSGSKVTYEYDENRNLVRFSDTKGNHKEYTYDENNYVTSITDKNGNVVTQNTYDDEGRVLEQIDGNGNVSTLTYEDQKTTLIKADGSKEEYYFNDNYDTTKIVQNGMTTSSYTYDAYRNITSFTDEEGKVTTYTYDKENLLKVEYPDGTYEEYRYDANNNVVYQRDVDGNVVENTYQNNDLVSTKDSNQKSVTYVYDAQRRVIQETDQYGASKSYTYAGNMIASITYSNGLVESFEYDANGNTVKESDNQGKVTTYLYNTNNEMIQKNYYDGTNEQWTYDANGNIASYKDRIGGVTNNTYDKNNNLLTSKKGNITIRNVYNELNQLVAETNEQGLTTSYTYDMYGNKVSETDAYGNTTTYEYDVDGNIIKSTDSFGNSEVSEYQDGNLVKFTSKEGLVTTYEYDAFNREIKKTNPNGTVETKEYKGLLLSAETDGKGSTITHEYDAYGKEVKTITTYADGVISTSENIYDMYGNIIETIVDGVSTKNTYDVYNQVIATSDALGNTTRKEYDFDGNVVKEIDALGNVSTTQYDGNQNVIATTDKNGNTETKRYDANGLLVSETDALGYVKTYTYNDKGQVIAVLDPYQNKAEYTYDAYGNQIEITLGGKTIEKREYDSHGRETYVQTSEERTRTLYDDFDRVIEKTNELIGLTTYTTYDEYGNVVEEKDSEGLTTTFTYDDYQRKVKSVDAYGREEIVTYNVRDQVISTTNYDGTITTSKYDDRGNVVETTDALGKVTKNTYNALNQLVKEEAGDKVTENVYDANGNIVEVKNVNNATSTKTIYDKNGNMIESIDVLGYSTKNEYDAKNQVIATIDANGNRSTKEYDAYGNVVKEIDALGNSKQYEYDQYGLLVLEIDERGFDTQYEYNDDLLVSKITDAKGATLTITYNEQLQKVKEINANGGSTEYEYDAYGREVKTIEPNGKTTTKEYDALGNVVKEVSGKKTTINTYDALGRLVTTSINDVVQTTNTYNELNQVIESEDANKNVSSYTYDSNGNVIVSNEKGFVSEKEYDVYGNLIRQIDNDTYVSENTYDALHRIIETKVNGKTTFTKEYDGNGNEVKIIENGVEQRTTYDALNRIEKVEIPSALDANTFVAIQSVEYDESGNAITISDANGNVEEKKFDANNNVVEETNKNGIKTSYEYDGMNNVIKVQNHNERYVIYTYDAANNVTFKTINNKSAEYKYDEENHLTYEKDEYGYVNQYTYDDFGNEIQWTKPDNTRITYTYDNVGNLLSEDKNTFTYDSRNNVLTSTNEEGTIKNTYDAFNNKIAVEDTNGEKVTYVFNQDNKLAKQSYAGVQVEYTYNANGQIDTITKNNQVIANYEYNARNEIVQLTQENAVTKKTYDDMGRVLTQISSKDGSVVYNAAYTYDANDNVIEEVVDRKTNTYTYNAYDELESSNKYVDGKLVTTTYKTDVFGNQITTSSSEGKKTYHYNDKNQIESIDTEKGIIRFSYDSNGNVAKKVNEDGRVDIYTYDALNQLVQLTQGQYVYDYTYDAEKERIQQVRTDTKDYHYDVWYNYSEPLDVVSESEVEDTFASLKEQAKTKQSNGNVCSTLLSDRYDVTYYKEPEVTDYVIDRNREYSEVLVSNDSTYVYSDTLLQSNNEDIVTGWNDSVVAEVSNQEVNTISYQDYGVTSATTAGHGYNSEMMDTTGLIYLRARYYDPSVARFIQIDNNYDGEQESVASQNRYVYTMNNPYKYVDKNGNWSLFKAIGDAVNNVVKTVKKVVKKAVKAVTNFFAPVVSKVNNIVSNVSKVSTWVNDIYNGITGNTTSDKGGGSNEKKPSLKLVDVIASCPKPEVQDLKDDIVDIITYCMDWPKLVNEVVKLFKSGFKTSWLSSLLSCIFEGKVRDKWVSVSGARDTVKKITGLGVGGKRPISSIISKVFKKSLGFNSIKTFAKFLQWGKLDYISVAADLIIGLVKPIGIIAGIAADAVYKILKRIGSTAIKTLFTPFIGPFSWLLATVLEIGMDIIDFFFDLKAHISSFIEWIMTQTWSFVTSFFDAIGGKL